MSPVEVSNVIPIAFIVATLAAIEVAPMPRIVPPTVRILPGEVPREISPDPRVPVVPADKE